MITNLDIYLIGLSVLIFLIILYFFVRKVFSSNDLKLEIKDDGDDIKANELSLKSQQSFDFIDDDTPSDIPQELAVINLISSTNTNYDMYQLFTYMKNSNFKFSNGFFVLKDSGNKEIFRVANAITPGILSEDSETFALIIATDLNQANDPLSAVNEMIMFATNFSEKFSARICDDSRKPITKQMISHLQSKAQEISRLNQLHVN